MQSIQDALARVDRPHQPLGDDRWAGRTNIWSVSGGSERRGGGIDRKDFQAIGARHEEVRGHVSRCPEGRVLRLGADPSAKGRRLMIHSAEAAALQEIPGSFLAGLEDQAGVAEEDRADRSDIGVRVVEGLPVRRMEVIEERQRGRELEHAFAVVVRRAAAAAERVSGRRIDVARAVNGQTAGSPDTGASGALVEGLVRGDGAGPGRWSRRDKTTIVSAVAIATAEGDVNLAIGKRQRAALTLDRGSERDLSGCGWGRDGLRP